MKKIIGIVAALITSVVFAQSFPLPTQSIAIPAQTITTTAGTIAVPAHSINVPAMTIVVTPNAPSPPVVVPPPPSTFTLPAGAYPIYISGVFTDGGDWSYGGTPVVNYKDTSGIPMDGPYDISYKSNAQWSGWLPFFQPNTAGLPSLPIGNYQYINISIKATKHIQWNMFWYQTVTPSSSNGYVNELPVGVGINGISKYASPAEVVGQWITYKIPLNAGGFAIPAGSILRKFSVQDNSGASSNLWYMDRVYLSLN